MVASEKIRTNIYLDKQTKIKAKELLKKYHISLSDAVNIFLSQTVLEQGLPFQVKIPNKETIKAMEEINNGETQSISLEEHLLEMKQCIKN